MGIGRMVMREFGYWCSNCACVIDREGPADMGIHSRIFYIVTLEGESKHIRTASIMSERMI